MKIKQSVLAAAVTAALAMGMAEQALAAYVYAGSVTEISNLVVTLSPGAVITNFNFNATNTATLNGVINSSTATCSGLPGPGGVGNNCGASPAPVLDGPTVSMGAPARPANVFTLVGPSSTSSWSNSDSLTPSATLVTFTPTSTKTVSEANLVSGGTTASANSELQSTTSFIFNFTLEAPGAFNVSFDADPRLRAAILGEPGLLNSALASNKLSLTLTQNTGGGRIINWSPNGSNFCDDSASLCTANDGAAQNRLNSNRSTGTNNTDIDFDPSLTSLSLGITGLDAGDWSLGLNVTNSVLLNRDPSIPPPVPIPTLSALGLASLVAMMGGLGLALRKRERQ